MFLIILGVREQHVDSGLGCDRLADDPAAAALASALDGQTTLPQAPRPPIRSPASGRAIERSCS